MLLTDISDKDAKMLLQLKSMLIKTVQEIKFSLGEAKIAQETIEWFDAFLAAASNAQKMERKQLAQKKTEGLSSVKIKEFSPGNVSKPKAKKVTRKK